MPAIRDLSDYTNAMGLVETIDDEVQRPLYRRPGINGEIASLQEMEEKISSFVRKSREDSGLTRAEFASLYGLSMAVYGRYERAFSPLTVGRMIHLSELLGFSPMEMIYAAAPHLFGKTNEEAADRFKLGRLIDDLPYPTVQAILQLIATMTPTAIDADGDNRTTSNRANDLS
ncbi:helix-turn-helix transcriptional regulator [Rhizobium sp. FKY42]|uniref:helix-turn-helix domain-containing protein n=1 Tax=Rhizobium sp. FKY42 TaxID=2562310 RepID=UPI0010C1111E|nr:helix-turn-helix transcriptional regulator [Rhizobium sp. FKY42]